MTGKQLEAAKDKHRLSGGSAYERKELNCITMMHSILIYDFHPDDEEFPFPEDNYYLQDYIKDLGKDRVKELWSEQIKDYRQAEVGPAGSYDDCDYNYCRWADE